MAIRVEAVPPAPPAQCMRAGLPALGRRRASTARVIGSAARKWPKCPPWVAPNRSLVEKRRDRPMEWRALAGRRRKPARSSPGEFRAAETMGRIELPKD